MTMIRYLNTYGDGFAGNIDVPDNMTIGELFAAKMGLEDHKSYVVRVNNQVTPRTQVLRAGDKVIITMARVEC